MERKLKQLNHHLLVHVQNRFTKPIMKKCFTQHLVMEVIFCAAQMRAFISKVLETAKLNYRNTHT